MAVTKALFRASDRRTGMLDPSLVGPILGSYAASFVEDLKGAMLTATPNALPINTKYETGDPESVEIIARSVPRSYGRERMPLLGDITDTFGGPDTFTGWEMASLSHLFATRPALYEELERNGLSREHHLVSGKGYSRNIDVVVSMQADGWTLDHQDFLRSRMEHHLAKIDRSLTKPSFAGLLPASHRT